MVVRSKWPRLWFRRSRLRSVTDKSAAAGWGRDGGASKGGIDRQLAHDWGHGSLVVMGRLG